MLALALALLASAAPVAEKVVQTSDWQPLFARGAIDEARTKCEAWLNSRVAQTRAEAHKCLADVELARAGDIFFETVDDRGSGRVGAVREAIDPDAARKAARHLTLALQLAPGDVTIHQGRLHILSLAGLYDMMMAALDESAASYRAGDTVGDVWLPLFGDLFDRGVHGRAIEYLTILFKHYPSDHRVVGNLAALHLEIGDPRGALPWAKKAAALSPRDVIDRVNLARIQHKLGDLDAAKREYDLAMSLPADEDRRMLVRCWYADLLVDARDEKRACRLQREAGERCAPTACAKK